MLCLIETLHGRQFSGQCTMYNVFLPIQTFLGPPCNGTGYREQPGDYGELSRGVMSHPSWK